jgi:hypothetical protein
MSVAIKVSWSGEQQLRSEMSTGLPPSTLNDASRSAVGHVASETGVCTPASSK